MKKSDFLLFTLLTTAIIILFFYFNKENETIKDEQNKVIPKTEATENKEVKEIQLNLNIIKDTNINSYEEKETYEKPVPLKGNTSIPHSNDTKVNVGVDMNKEKRSIDSIEIDVQKKF
jgi:glucosamine 6-phosphate synthetase-like amidotransferase/phosphosugar isomerase protein